MSLSRQERKILDFFQENPDQSYKTDQIAQHFNYKGSKNYKKLVKALAFLERVGELELTESGRFKIANTNTQMVGIFSANDKGYGFVSVDEDEPDLFIPPGKTGEAMDGDKVEVKVIKKVNPLTGKGSEAQIERVIERSVSQLVGEFFAYNQSQREETGYIGYISPKKETTQTLKVFILPEGIHPADHSICVVKIKDYPTEARPGELTGLVSNEIGHRDEPGVDILEILFQFGIPHEFPDNVREEAASVPNEISSADIEGRKDLRNQLTFTIDGADAKDLDDAISLTMNNDDTYQLGVHIADVSHYVTEGSALDDEAYERGTSVYLTDRVVPMLPQRLSNGICSLHPNEDRLTQTCEMTIDQKGKVIKYDIYSSVINSNYRMTYANVNAILDGDKELREEYGEIVTTLENMADLHHILEKMRHRRGALDFDSPEAKIIVDESGHPIDIELRERYVGERLIESFMLAANETVARHFKQKELPFIYRIHENPDEEKMARYAEFVTAFGLVLRGKTEHISPKQLQETLAKAKGEPYENVLSMMLLRSMQQAKYSEEPIGHYGLAAQDYTHFTSPIRRYPDLIVHRLIRTYSKGRPSNKLLDRLEDRLPIIADHSSQMERRAVDAERETDAMKKAEYMEERVGEEFEGQISSITSFGMFIQLPNTVEGLITLDKLSDDYYQYNQQNLLLIGERTGKVYRIGQKVTVEVERVSVPTREIDFHLIDAEPIHTSDMPDHIQTEKPSRSGRRGNRKRSQDRNAKNRKETSVNRNNKKPSRKFKISKRK